MSARTSSSRARGRSISWCPLSIRCRHTVGLNWTAIGIEHTGFSDAEVLGDRAQMRASLRLTRYLRCRFHIKLRNVIGHNESLSSPFHRERVAEPAHTRPTATGGTARCRSTDAGFITSARC